MFLQYAFNGSSMSLNVRESESALKSAASEGKSSKIASILECSLCSQRVEFLPEPLRRFALGL